MKNKSHRNEIGPVFQPVVIQFADTLPKMRNGKIMQRILKAIAAGTDIGNVTILTNLCYHQFRQQLIKVVAITNRAPRYQKAEEFILSKFI